MPRADPATGQAPPMLSVELVCQQRDAVLAVPPPAHPAPRTASRQPPPATPQSPADCSPPDTARTSVGSGPPAVQPPAGYTLQRSQHRVPAGTTIRQILLGQPEGSALVAAIDARQLGLARFGRRAWLDDPVQPDDRIEILQPLVADARAARFARVAQARAAKGRGRRPAR